MNSPDKTIQIPATGGFANQCRSWRRARRLSQLDLATTAEVSQRHVSWLETGRSQPSREMVVRLADAMDVPLRSRNDLLLAAGYSPLYQETELDAPAMASVFDALQRVLDQHEPMPAMVVDRRWQIRRMNKAATKMLALGNQLIGKSTVGSEQNVGTRDTPYNLAELTMNDWRSFISNWDQVAPNLILRLRRDAASAPDMETRNLLNGYADLAGERPDPDLATTSLLPVLPVQLQIGTNRLSLFTVITTFGTPQDITTDELRIESFYPSDDITRAFFEQLT